MVIEFENIYTNIVFGQIFDLNQSFESCSKLVIMCSIKEKFTKGEKNDGFIGVDPLKEGFKFLLDLFRIIPVSDPPALSREGPLEGGLLLDLGFLLLDGHDLAADETESLLIVMQKQRVALPLIFLLLHLQPLPVQSQTLFLLAPVDPAHLWQIHKNSRYPAAVLAH